MIPYNAPIADLRFLIEEVIGIDRIAALPGYESVTADLVGDVLSEAGKLASEVIAPLNRSGDIEGSRLENGVVITPKGFAEAYEAFWKGGWVGISADPAYGGQGLPTLLAASATEMWSAANLAFALCPGLAQGGIDALTRHGSAEQQRTWLPKMVSGEWPVAMALTEPHAGSDVGALRTRATKDGKHYRLKGQKIFITWGEHAMTPNIVHMVLARTEGAAPGTKGLSLFVVPKYLLNDDGTPGRRNDFRAVAVEHKLGIKASPTCVMAYGDNEGALGELVGSEGRGMEYMFAMMNAARFVVGLQGVALADRAYQQAAAYAKQRVQGRDLAQPGAGPIPIVRHPDVRRMLMTMRANSEAGRGLNMLTALATDEAARHPDKTQRAAAQARLDLLTPIVKAWCSDIGVEAASIGIQIHGGAGFLEETGAAQHLRDARIAPIYEGTNGIQALDLIRRKVAGDEGQSARALIGEIRASFAGGDADSESIRRALGDSADALERATGWIAATFGRDVRAAAAGATPYLRLFGAVLGGWALYLSARAAQRMASEARGNRAFANAKRATAAFYAETTLALAPALAAQAMAGADAVMALADDDF